jgi:hypothetical protein
MLAVSTRYYGVQYRSRTEAEWAAALKAHEIECQYEPRVFLFGLVAPPHWQYADAYLPDFWLPAHRLWLEVKPHAPNLIEYRKAALLAECTGSGVLIATGGPNISDAMILVKDHETREIVSTLANGSYKQGPLKLDIDHLSEAQDVHTPARNFNEGLIDAIQTSCDAFCALPPVLPAKPRPKRVLYLLPGADHGTECFHGQGRFCHYCRDTIRTFVTDESAARLKSSANKTRNEHGNLGRMV